MASGSRLRPPARDMDQKKLDYFLTKEWGNSERYRSFFETLVKESEHYNLLYKRNCRTVETFIESLSECKLTKSIPVSFSLFKSYVEALCIQRLAYWLLRKSTEPLESLLEDIKNHVFQYISAKFFLEPEETSSKQSPRPEESFPQSDMLMDELDEDLIKQPSLLDIASQWIQAFVCKDSLLVKRTNQIIFLGGIENVQSSSEEKLINCLTTLISPYSVVWKSLLLEIIRTKEGSVKMDELQAVAPKAWKDHSGKVKGNIGHIIHISLVRLFSNYDFEQARTENVLGLKISGSTVSKKEYVEKQNRILPSRNDCRKIDKKYRKVAERERERGSCTEGRRSG